MKTTILNKLEKIFSKPDAIEQETQKALKELRKLYPKLEVRNLKGEVDMYLNPQLIIAKRVEDENIEQLVKLHKERIALFAVMEAMGESEYTTPAGAMILKECVEKLEKLEFAMQRAWHFEESVNHHTWWILAPHCICPRMDNQERWGTPHRIIRGNCPLHGSPETEETEA